MDPKIDNLVVDTSAFIKEFQLQDIAQNFFTVQEVVDEIVSKRQLRRLVVLPYNLIIKEVFPENVSFVSEFAKKTGDYTSLSATDIKVIALTYQLEKEILGIRDLKNEPVTQKLTCVTKNRNNILDVQNPEEKNKSVHDKSQDLNKSVTANEFSNVLSHDLESKLYIDEQKQDDTSEDILPKVAECFSEHSSTESSDDEESWITPTNIEDVKKSILIGPGNDDNEKVTVACITLDFAMQNVLKQIGLQVTTLDGKLIKQIRTFIFRCTTCFKTTSCMTKRFCPKCGHESLRRVAVSIDENGQQVIHINGKKPLTARGKRYSLPTPRGGQHALYPILTEDQPVHNRHVTKLARTKNNPLDTDYIAGYSPFVARDVNSKSALLGVRKDSEFKHWMKKNPNESRRKPK